MVTPVILTYNEEPNIAATLGALSWAERIVVMDSGSTDQTEGIARSYPNVSWFHRGFDTHGAQWRAAIEDTSIATSHILALDADMRPGPGFEEELNIFLSEHGDGCARISFEYRVLGRALAGSIYPPQIRLFRKDNVRVEQIGHSQAFVAPEPVYHFRSRVIHEDNKPLDRWLRNQVSYASLEANRIQASRRKSFKDRLRILGISPAVWGLYAYGKSGGPFKGAASKAYATERLIFEAILSHNLMTPAPPAKQ